MSLYNTIKLITIICGLLMLTSVAYSQCNTIRPQRDITFNTDQDCAPVTVTDFTITYYFNVPQDPSMINVVFEWNDPDNNVDIVGLGSGMIVSGGNTEFTASGAFIYDDNDGQCTILPTAYIYINGAVCASSAQVQPAFFWGTDEQANGNLFVNPTNYDVCYNEPITNAIFTDNSDFNCRIAIEPDNPNRQNRHVQFVYGTNHNAATSIADLSLDDGTTQLLTNGTGALISTDTRGTAGLPVTGVYFGPIDEVPFPADNPISSTFPMSAPANPINAVGNYFEVTMFNWNVCNPYNGDVNNPNYEDAIFTTAYIRIVDGPNPDFLTRRENAGGVITNTFCIGEQIYFDNETVGANIFNFSWQFFDDNSGASEVYTSTARNPIYAYASSGEKLVRLTASNPTAQGSCDEIYEAIINIAPALVANIGISDPSGNTISTEFCQDSMNSLVFDMRFSDISEGTAGSGTQWRWEFYDENDNLIQEHPASGGYSDSELGPFDISFINPGVYRTVLSITDNATTCETMDESYIYIYSSPVADFVTDNVCVGNAVSIQDVSSLTPINGEKIVNWEWDPEYDGMSFNANSSYSGLESFDHTYTTAGTYDVALRVTTDANNCSSIVTKTVEVYPFPLAEIIPDTNAGCSILPVTFTNVYANGQPTEIDQYIWEIDFGTGFLVDSVQRPGDDSFSEKYVREFENSSNDEIYVDYRLRVVSGNGCEQLSNVERITILPTPKAGFNSINYSPFDDNCSPLTVNFRVDGDTQAQSPSEYFWEINDASGTITQQSSGTSPMFEYTFVNEGQSFKDYTISLTSSLNGACSGDSTIRIRVNPIPSAIFNIDTLSSSCSDITLRALAQSAGMANYFWSLSTNGTIVYTETESIGELVYSINRADMDQLIEIQLVTENFAGCQSSPAIEQVLVEQEKEIKSAFSASPLVQYYPDTTVILNNLNIDTDLEYEWDFGDGNKSFDGQLTEYHYMSPGTYIITLTTRSGDCQDVSINTVIIHPALPRADFDYNPSQGCAPLTVTFTNRSEYAGSGTYFWDFGDGNTSTDMNPVHTYFEAGLYSVSLTASNSSGQTDTEVKSQIIEVYESPFAQFEIRPNIVSIPDNPIYTNNSSLRATSYLWDFGDGNQSTEEEPIHYYQNEGLYTVSLVASNIHGCVDTLVREGIVKAEEVGRLLIPNAFTPSSIGPSGGNIESQSGINDIFLPITVGVKEFEMMVFNRWGELLFKSSDKRVGWDGYHNGVLCQQDTYVYKLYLVFENGRSTTRVGDINLIR